MGSYFWRAGEYSRGFKEKIKEPALADEARAVEGDNLLDPAESRRRYTAPAEAAEAR